jgi:hypothetical protein
MPNDRKLVDPVHLFDERGHSLSSYDRLETENARLRAEVARLRSNLERINKILANSRAQRTTPPFTH